MAHEADFYSAEEVARALKIPIRRVFGMLCGGELEGYQDEWARWHVPASAMQGVRRSLEPSSDLEEGPLKDDAETRVAEDATRVGDADATPVRSDGGSLLDSPAGMALTSDEETTQEAREVPVSGAPSSYNSAGNGDAEAATEVLPRVGYEETVAPEAASNETIRELDEQLAAATAKTSELRDRLALAEATEAALRESLKREREKADQESLLSEQQRRAATGQPEKEPAGERDEGFWRGLFGG
jgi:hypothetical protein